MEQNKKKFSFGEQKKVKMTTQSDMKDSMKDLFSKNKQQSRGFSLNPQGQQQQQGSWKPPQSQSIAWKPPGSAEQQQPRQQYQQPRRGQPQQSTFGSAFKKPEPAPEPQPQEEEPYWSAVEWEEWAHQLYTTYSDTRQFLPQWFIEAVEQQE